MAQQRQPVRFARIHGHIVPIRAAAGGALAAGGAAAAATSVSHYINYARAGLKHSSSLKTAKMAFSTGFHGTGISSGISAMRHGLAARKSLKLFNKSRMLGAAGAVSFAIGAGLLAHSFINRNRKETK